MEDLDPIVNQAIGQGLHQATRKDLEGRLELELRGNANFNQLYPPTLGTSRVSKFFEAYEQALRKELCEGGKLKQKYHEMLGSSDAASTVKSLATSVLSLISPQIAVGTLGVLVALWLLRVGLNQWCAGTDVKG